MSTQESTLTPDTPVVYATAYYDEGERKVLTKIFTYHGDIKSGTTESAKFTDYANRCSKSIGELTKTYSGEKSAIAYKLAKQPGGFERDLVTYSTLATQPEDKARNFTWEVLNYAEMRELQHLEHVMDVDSAERARVNSGNTGRKLGRKSYLVLIASESDKASDTKSPWIRESHTALEPKWKERKISDTKVCQNIYEEDSVGNEEIDLERAREFAKKGIYPAMVREYICQPSLLRAPSTDSRRSDVGIIPLSQSTANKLGFLHDTFQNRYTDRNPEEISILDSEIGVVLGGTSLHPDESTQSLI
ncbi:uncharacterized protein L201_005630 [Kwoniella dendrophila CBS 6074]|uniref:Uncharacterized protein n=1 Tax=Kwoniella dendrophila CBS 6074 TaxID=1295534 RepID=A0AAX4K0W0_9TREE